MYKRNLIIIVLILLSLGVLSAQQLSSRQSKAGTPKDRYKALLFANPGTKRMLKTEAGNYYYFRSLPEKAITLDVTGISLLEIRSFSTDSVKKPEVIVLSKKTRQAFPLEFDRSIGAQMVYKPLRIKIDEGTTEIQLLCYSRSVYLRAFNVLPPKPAKPAKLKNLEMKAHAGVVALLHNGSSSDYYSMMSSQALKFSVNNRRNAVVYVRPRLLDRTKPKLGLYKDGKLVKTIEFGLKRTTKYHVEGVKNLGIAQKIELPANTGSSDYELRAISDHLFFAKPVLIKSAGNGIGKKSSVIQPSNSSTKPKQ